MPNGHLLYIEAARLFKLLELEAILLDSFYKFQALKYSLKTYCFLKKNSIIAFNKRKFLII